MGKVTRLRPIPGKTGRLESVGAMKAREAAEEISACLDAFAFSGNELVLYRDEDGSSGLLTDAFALEVDGWHLIFREHGPPVVIPIEKGDTYAIRLVRFPVLTVAQVRARMDAGRERYERQTTGKGRRRGKS